jgi:hypothetical protein
MKLVHRLAVIGLVLPGCAFAQSHAEMTLQDTQTVSGNKTFTGTNVHSGTSTMAVLNGVYNGNACASSPAPSWCSGSDLGAWINSAASACSGACVIHLPAGTYTLTTTATISKPGVSVVGDGSAATTINYAGSGDVFRVQMNPFVITQAGRIEGFTINCNRCGSSANGIHFGDVIGLRLIDFHIENFSGAGSACLWTDNVLGWTERTSEQAVHLDNCNIAHKWTNTTNTQTTSSFGHSPLIEERWNLNGRQTGWSVTSGLIYDDGVVSITGNSTNTNTLFTISGTQYSGGGATAVSTALWSVEVEQSAGGPSTIFSLSRGASFAGCGFVNTFGLTIGTSSGISINDTACPLFNGQSFAVRSSSGTSDPVIGMNTSNQTVIQGDGSEQQILLQPKPGTTLVQAGPATFGIQANTSLVFGEGTAPSTNGGNDFIWGDSSDHVPHYVANNGNNQQFPQVAFLAGSAYTNAMTNFTSVTGLSFTVAAGRNYKVECRITWQGSATTAGRWINEPDYLQYSC